MLTRVRAAAILGVAVAGVLGILGVTVAAPASALVSVDDSSRVWIYGKKVKQSSGYCFSNGARGEAQKLQLRDNSGAWQTVATSRKYVRSNSCDAKFPLTVIYTFTVSELGEPNGNGAFDLQAREIFSDGESNPFIKTVYRSEEDHAGSLLQGFLDSLGNPVS